MIIKWIAAEAQRNAVSWHFVLDHALCLFEVTVKSKSSHIPLLHFHFLSYEFLQIVPNHRSFFKIIGFKIFFKKIITKFRWIRIFFFVVRFNNPLCPTNPESFWSTTLAGFIDSKCKNANHLISMIENLYTTWNLEYCKGSRTENVGLDQEAYFKFFDYADFVTPYSGLIQIKKYAEIHNTDKLLSAFEKITEQTKIVKEEIYQLLVHEFKYFE